MEKEHVSFTISPSGLWIDPKNPHIAATPQAIASCDCHSSGCIEVKCPMILRNLSSAADADSRHMCLKKSPDGRLALKKSHPYWYQVQLQLNVSQYAYAYFIVWTEEDFHVEVITRDDKFFDRHLAKVDDMYKLFILPELLAKFYSKPEEVQHSGSYCFCNSPDDTSLDIICANPGCKRKKFHFQCLGLLKWPGRYHVCSECQALSKMPSPNDPVRQLSFISIFVDLFFKFKF